MRKLARLLRQESGATAVLVALLMIPLIGVAALAVDVGAMYWENAQLQNGADAAALAVAKDCSDPIRRCGDYQSTAARFARASASDDLVDAEVTFPNNCATAYNTGQYVKVKTTTRARSASGAVVPVLSVPLYQATQQLLGNARTDVTETTTACARWGYPSAYSPALPLAISMCDFPSSLPGGQVSVPINTQSQSSCPTSSGYPPGGFGWLDNASCASTIRNGSVLGDPGNSYPGSCDSVLAPIAARLAAGEQVTMLLPLYNSTVAASGRNGQNSYQIVGFGAFVITGWKFSGNPNAPQTYNPGSCTGSCRGIQGRFVALYPDVTELGGSQYLGVTSISLVG